MTPASGLVPPDEVVVRGVQEQDAVRDLLRLEDLPVLRDELKDRVGVDEPEELVCIVRDLDLRRHLEPAAARLARDPWR